MRHAAVLRCVVGGRPPALTLPLSPRSGYLAAGADFIETCSFNGTSISMADYGMEALSFEINVAAAKLAEDGAVIDAARLAAN